MRRPMCTPAPITYELDGVQYIAASVGGAAQGDYFAPSYGRMLVFKVGGTVKLPPNAPYTARALNPPALTAPPPSSRVARSSMRTTARCAMAPMPRRAAAAPALRT